MFLTLPEEVRLLLRKLQHQVFMLYRHDDGKYYFLFSEGMIAERFGLQTRRVKGIPIESLLHPEAFKAFTPQIELCMNGASVKFEINIADSWLLVSLEPVTGNRGACEVVGSAMDITTMKLAEQELRAALEQERQLGLLKSRFVYTVSHEFRTPLTGISVAAELLEQYYDRMNGEQRRQSVASIRERTAELTMLIEDLLQQSSTKSLAMIFEPELITNAEELCDSIIEDFLASLSRITHKIECAFSPNTPPVLWDARLVKHILRNLLSNAMKYSPAGTTITVAVFGCESNMRIEVRDRGMGIAESDLPHIFTPFFRSNSAEGVKGTGLGLSIVKEFVELHGGTIKAESALGAGTTIFLEFPSAGTADNMTALMNRAVTTL